MNILIQLGVLFPIHKLVDERFLRVDENSRAKQSGKRGGYAPSLHYLRVILIIFVRDDI